MVRNPEDNFPWIEIKYEETPRQAYNLPGEADRRAANIFAITSPDLLYRGYAGARKGGEASSYLERLMRDDEAAAPVVTVLDGHSHALGFIGGALGTIQLPLGVDDFGQSGTRADLYRHYGIDAESIARGARALLE